MKKIIVLLLVIVPILSFGQSKPDFFEEWERYLNDCNELVPDTVTQYGEVNCRLVPVKMSGKIISYNTVPVDTVWYEYKCADYKFSDYGNLTLGFGLSTTTTVSTYKNTGVLVPASTEPAKTKFNITREIICNIKKHKTSVDDFLNRWCVERKLITFN